MQFEKIDEGLYRIFVPFQDLYTTVYVVQTKKGTALIDSATYPTDADDFILPALQEIGIAREEIQYLLLTHSHGDHAGGLARLSECLPHAKVRASFDHSLQKGTLITDGEDFLECLKAVSLPGHTPNSVGYLDTRSKTLLSGDCLQLKRIGKYRDGIRYPDLYIESVKRLQKSEIDRIVAAHDYDPLGSIATGHAAVEEYLRMCLEIAENLDKT
jgi:glyoxylase-like metal-dependent hydrolase (beta-lactamase superfamily II)